MGKFDQVIVLEVEIAKDKNPETPGGKYRRDTPWLVEAFKKKGVKSSIRFITNKDSADSLVKEYGDSTAFLGRVNPMSYETITIDEYIGILNELTKKGKLFGPIPDHMDRLGSKKLLFDLRDSVMGLEGIIFHTLEDMTKADSTEIDRILPADGGSRVLKMLRGSTGLGVWKLANKDGKILMTDAFTQQDTLVPRNEVIPSFLKICKEAAISMPFLPLIKDGEFRYLMSKHKVLEIVHKKPVDENAFTATLRSGAIYTILDLNEHKSMVETIENWSKELKGIMKMDDVPYWWSVDCIEKEAPTMAPGQIPSTNAGRRLVLSEVNCSCLGLVADTSEEAKLKGMRFADMIADICLG